jgi:hypothetical protein
MFDILEQQGRSAAALRAGRLWAQPQVMEEADGVDGGWMASLGRIV